MFAPAALAANGQAESNASKTTGQDRVQDALRVVKQMRRDPRLASTMQRARGIFVIPHYGKGAFIVGGQGGGGVVLVDHAGTWSDPAFFSMGGGSIGLQAGGEGGAVAMLLMTQKAVDQFEHGGTWSLNANAGLTVATWSGKGQANTGTGDVILWSDTDGLYGGLTASVTRINSDNNLDQQYYHRHVNARQILTGSVRLAVANAAPLRRALSMRVATR